MARGKRSADGRPMPAEKARRIALAAQGFAEPRPAGRVDVRHIRRVIERVAVLQIDSVNVLCRSHYLPVFARLGPYDRSTLDRMCWGGSGRELFEYWAHAASLLPLDTYPLLDWRMRVGREHVWHPDLRQWRKTVDPALLGAPWAAIEGMTRIAQERPGLLDEVLAIVRDRGPMTAGEVHPVRSKGPAVEGGRMWNWHDAKIALEWMFYTGQVTTASRRGFERVYDLTERVLPASALNGPAPGREDAQRELVRKAVRAHGIATERQVRDYFHLPADDSKARVAELAESGELLRVKVEGVPQPMYLWPDAREPSSVRARALLSPFDSLIWDRDRTLRLFGFHYRISLYTPAAQRVHGYYVLPFLLGENLVARVDLKADRKESALLVPTVNAEPDLSGTGRREVAAELAAELSAMAGWLGLDRVVVGGRGDLAPELARTVKRA